MTSVNSKQIQAVAAIYKEMNESSTFNDTELALFGRLGELESLLDKIDGFMQDEAIRLNGPLASFRSHISQFQAALYRVKRSVESQVPK